jgi:hypothetical protein
MSDIGCMTNDILGDAIDIVEIWKTAPWRRGEFGHRELEDIRRAREQLAGLEGYIVIHMIKRIA